MADWTPSEWITFFIALGTFLNTALIAIATFLAALAKIRGDTNADKIDNNTKITVAGTIQAVTSAKVAAEKAADAKTAAEELQREFNGNLDKRIEAAVKTAVMQAIRDLK